MTLNANGVLAPYNANDFNPDNILTGIYNGAAYIGPVGAPGPTGFNNDLAVLGYQNLGFITDDGAPTLSLPGEGDSNPVRVWQNAQVVRTIRTPNDEPPTFGFTLAETTRAAIEIAMGAQVDADGSYVVDGSAERGHFSFVLDVLTAEGGRRYWAPNAVVTETGETTFTNDGAIAGLPVTVAADFSPAINGNIKVWDTALAGSGTVTPPPPDPDDDVRSAARGHVGPLADDAAKSARGKAAPVKETAKTAAASHRRGKATVEVPEADVANLVKGTKKLVDDLAVV